MQVQRLVDAGQQLPSQENGPERRHLGRVIRQVGRQVVVSAETNTELLTAFRVARA